MKTRMLTTALALALLAGAAHGTPAPKDAPASPPALPKLNISTMLFLMLGQNEAAANTSDPIDINAFDIDFGGDDDAMTAAIDAVLEGK